MSKQLVIHLPRGVEQYEHDIRRFVDAMIYKLNLHRSKGRWEDCQIEDMIVRMQDEIVELQEAIEDGNLIEVLLEAADTANFALIIAAIATERGINDHRIGRQNVDGPAMGHRVDSAETNIIRPFVSGGPDSGSGGERMVPRYEP